jgi:hypothetical protein
MFARFSCAVAPNRCRFSLHLVMGSHKLFWRAVVSSSRFPGFEYRPLVKSDAIRVLVVHPDQNASAQLECSLEHTTLSRYKEELADHYTALSYAWGDPRDTRTVVVDGHLLDVTVNLASALRDIRDEQRVLRI